MKCLGQKRKHVFCLTADPKIQKVTKQTLKQLGVVFKHFTEVDNYLSRLYFQRCDLLIADLKMFRINPVERVIEIKQLIPDVPLLLITGHVNSTSVISAIKARVEHVMEEPINKHKLLLKIRLLLNKSTSSNQLRREILSENGFQNSEERQGLHQQILEAAKALFSDKGYRGTSIRDITKSARCNLSAVNYHFHSKEKLYIEVFRMYMEVIREQKLDRIGRELIMDSNRMDLASIIRLFAEIFLEPFLTEGYGPQLMRLMIHEREDPHLPPGLFLNEVIQPIRSSMRQAILRIYPELSKMNADLCIYSIMAQLLNNLQLQDMFKKLGRKDKPLLEIDRSINHIVRFSVAGIRQYVDDKKSE